MSLRLGILGATGLVGGTMLTLLEERGFPVDELRLLASGRSDTRTLRFRGRDISVLPVSAEAFAGLEVVLSAVSNPLAEEWVPVARAAGAVVVDNSSAFRYDPSVPLVIPEVNGALLGDLRGLESAGRGVGAGGAGGGTGATGGLDLPVGLGRWL
jgi:aspartate-semialdehyde dehydrogenase